MAAMPCAAIHIYISYQTTPSHPIPILYHREVPSASANRIIHHLTGISDRLALGVVRFGKYTTKQASWLMPCIFPVLHIYRIAPHWLDSTTVLLLLHQRIPQKVVPKPIRTPSRLFILSRSIPIHTDDYCTGTVCTHTHLAGPE